MKYELSDKEFIKIHQSLDKMIDAFKSIAELHFRFMHDIELRRLQLDERKLDATFRQATKGIKNETASGMPSQVVSDYRTQGIDPENPFDLHKGDLFPEPELTDHQQRGKQELEDLVELWLENFRVEDEPQPDRNTFMQELGYDGKRAGSIISYSMKVGGLTKALWNIFVETERPLDAELVRYLGGNIAQVASIHLAPLADEFEYPNPIKHLEK